MTPQELKNSILQQAIQGRLVEQRPDEGTAEELYQQIQAEKQRLIKEKKIKKDKTLPEITEDEKPFEIPSNWFWVRLGEVLIIERGGSPRPIKDYLTDAPDGINWIKIGDTDKGGKFINSTLEKIKPEGVKKSRFVHKGDFLLSNSMSFGRPYILNIDGCIHDGWLVLRPVIELFDKEYLYYILSSQMVYKQFCSRVAGAVVNNLNSDKVAITLVPVPPLAEQKRIAAKIEELLPLIDRYEVAWSRLEAFNKRFPDDMQKAILQQAIQGKLVEQRPEEGTGEELYQQILAEKQALIKAKKIKKNKPLPEITDDEKPFEIPEGWKWVRLVELGSFSSGKTPNMGTPEFWNGGTVNWMTSKDMKQKFLSESSMKITEAASESMTIYPPGTLLMVVRSGILKRMLPLCVLTQESTINQDLKAYSLYDLTMSSYIYYALKGLEPNILLNYTKRVTTVDSLKFDEFSRKMPVPLPPLAEQKRIVSKIEQLLPLCERLK